MFAILKYYINEIMFKKYGTQERYFINSLIKQTCLPYFNIKIHTFHLCRLLYTRGIFSHTDTHQIQILGNHVSGTVGCFPSMPPF